MSITLLYHTNYIPTCGPISGICRKDDEELVFVVDDPTKYTNSSIKLFRPSSEQLNYYNIEQSKIRDVIGGYNDYGELFKIRPKRFGITGIVTSVLRIDTSNMELVGEFKYSNIINPYQNIN